jgi:long-chain acyl-CoA synthetase
VIDGERQVAYGELACKAEGLAAVLAASTKAPAIAVYLPTGVGFVTSAYAIWRAGKALVPLNLLLPPATLALVLQDAGVDTIITSEKMAPALAELSVKLILLEELARAAAAGQTPPMQALEGATLAAPEELAILLYTSGTTGMPKGVRLTHSNVYTNIMDCLRTFEIAPGEVIIGVLPLFHTFALTATMGIPLHSGGTFVTHMRFNPEATLESIQQHKVTLLIAVPTMYRVLTQLQRMKPFDVSSLKYALAGGEPLPPRIEREFEEVFGIELLQGYGLTETSPVVSVNPPKANRSGTAGPPLPSVNVRVVDEDGNDVPVGEVGELIVSGPTVMDGYHNHPDETARVIKGGWLYTGDMARFDEHGHIAITGRKKEMIIVGGLNVFPAEIEALLEEHPAVAHCAVMGYADERHGEIIKAYVVPKEPAADKVQAAGAGDEAQSDAETLEAQLRDYLKAKLPAYKVPKKIELRSELPLGPTGKVLKRALVQ